LSREPLLAEREHTHGSYRLNADMAQSIKNAYRKSPTWDKLTTRQRESLDFIASKIGRILSGNPDHIDHWDDIAGYANLILEELREKNARTVVPGHSLVEEERRDSNLTYSALLYKDNL